MCLYLLRAPEFKLGCVSCCDRDRWMGGTLSAVSFLPHRYLMDKAPSCCAWGPANVFEMFHSLFSGCKMRERQHMRATQDTNGNSPGE